MGRPERDQDLQDTRPPSCRVTSNTTMSSIVILQKSFCELFVRDGETYKHNRIADLIIRRTVPGLNGFFETV
jgi:hypothetical protein